MPEDQPLSVFVGDREKGLVRGRACDDPLLGFLTLSDPCVEFFLSGERGAVNTLHLFALSIAFQ